MCPFACEVAHPQLFRRPPLALRLKMKNGSVLVRSLKIEPTREDGSTTYADLSLRADLTPVLGPRIVTAKFEVMFQSNTVTHAVESCAIPWHYFGPFSLVGEVCARFGGRYIPPLQEFQPGECLMSP